MRIATAFMALFFIVSAFAPLASAQNETREEMLAWIAKLDKRDAELQKEMENAAQQPRNGLTLERVEIWDSKTVLKKVAEWKIAHLKDDNAKKALVFKEFLEALAHIKSIYAAWDDDPRGSGATEFEGTAIVELVRRQIALWLLPDDEYEKWMGTWSNAKLSFQGKVIPLISGMAYAKVRNKDSEVEFLLKRENCFTIDGENYALVEKNYVAAVNDDYNRIYLYRLEPNGMATLIEEVVREYFASKIKLNKEREGCLRVDWTEYYTGKEESTWILLLE